MDRKLTRNENMQNAVKKKRKAIKFCRKRAHPMLSFEAFKLMSTLFGQCEDPTKNEIFEVQTNKMTSKRLLSIVEIRVEIWKQYKIEVI